MDSTALLKEICIESERNNRIDVDRYTAEYDVKRGLRNRDGTGVLAGITRIGNVLGYYVQDGERYPAPGKLYYRGIDIDELIDSFIKEDRFGYEETAYLLLFGDLPTRERLEGFRKLLEEYQELPPRFTEDMILPAPSRDVMNKLARSILALYSYDPDPENNSYMSQMNQALHLIARCPVIVAHALQQHYFDGKSLYLHYPKPGLTIAENFSAPSGTTRSSPNRKPGCWICAWCSTRSTAAATTRPLPAVSCPRPAPISIPP